MHTKSLLIAALLTCTSYAAVSANDIIKCLDSIADQTSKADSQAKRMNTADLIGGSGVSP